MINIILTTWKRLLRNKGNTFWILCFPVVLGTLFNVIEEGMKSKGFDCK